MVNIKKILWIPILMIFSQIMLTGFVGYWLVSQYNDENDLLQEELSRIYDETRNQVIDSLLFNRVIEPALNDSVTITMMAAEGIDTAAHKVTSTMHGAFFAKKDTCENTMVTISLPDSIADKRIGSAASFIQSDNKHNLLIRSVRLFINHSSDTTASRVGFPLFLPGNPDTTLFKKVYNEKIAQRKYGIVAVWSAGNAKNEKNEKSVKNVKNEKNVKNVKGVKKLNDIKDVNDIGIVEKGDTGGLNFKSVFPDNLPQVEVKHTFPFLIKRIGAQILFALILLLLTGSAFFFTNRSLKRQLILNSLRNDFVSNITHELRTPVSTVKVALEALKTFDKVSNPKVTREYLDMAGQEMNRLDQLISKVLDQSLIGEQKQVIQPQISDLKYLIENVLLSLQPRLDARKATVKFDPSEIPGSVMVDPLHFQGVLINLIDNSLKYGPEIPEIEIRLWQDNGSACIEVIDNGPGIPKEYIGRVFDKFFRVPTGDTHNIKGYGLGLSFASLVMKQHQGSITVRNNESAGCTFALRFLMKTI